VAPHDHRTKTRKMYHDYQTGATPGARGVGVFEREEHHGYQAGAHAAPALQPHNHHHTFPTQHRQHSFGVRCTFSDRNAHSRMPLVLMPARLKRCHACDQWHSSREFTPSYRLTL
jgi:hypothetical protein